MTMHLLPAYYTTTVGNRKRKKNSKKCSQTEHEKWLQKRGLTQDQLATKKSVDNNWQTEYANSLKVERKYKSVEMVGSKNSCARRGVMENIHKEPEHVRKQILEKASRCMPLYNKGGIQYATPETDMKTVGTKSRRG